VWEYNKEGKKVHKKVDPPLYFFVTTPDETEYKSIYGDNVKKLSFTTYSKFRDAKEMYKSANRKVFESDVDVETKYIIENWAGKEFEQPVHDINYVDIEVHSETGFPHPDQADHPITIITVYSTKNKKFTIFAQKDFNRDFTNAKGEKVLQETDDVYIIEDEAEMLSAFISFIGDGHVDILSGWNSEFYDIPYIINRANKILGEDEAKKISPLEHIETRTQTFKDGKERTTYEIAGLNCIDYLPLYKKYNPKQQSSFKLDYIAKSELGESKLEYEGTLKDLYRKDWQKYVEYNIQDVALLHKLDNKLGFMKLMIDICYSCCVPFSQYEKTTKVLDGAFISTLKLENVVVPDANVVEGNQYEGAFVRDPEVGCWDWIVSYDATSLYPSIMIQHNISPETKIYKCNEKATKIIMGCLEGKESEFEPWELNLQACDQEISCKEMIAQIKEKKYSISTNGVIYSHEKIGVIPRFLVDWFSKRQFHKKKQFECEKLKDHNGEKLHKGRQTIFKILLNSCYGYLGSIYSRFYEKDNALAVTATGQEIIKCAMDSINTYFQNWHNTELGKKLKAVSIENTVTYGDTDSVVSNMELRLDNGEIITISDLFNTMMRDEPDSYKIHYTGEREFIFPKKLKLPYYDNHEIKYGRVQYIERHHVSKPIFRIKSKSGKYIDVTADHSCMVLENGQLKEKKAIDIRPGDKIITINIPFDCQIEEVESVEYLNSDPQYVFDVGMEDTPHTFFANDILVHNSLYINAGRVLDAIGYKDKDNIEKTSKFIDEKICKIFVQVINKNEEHVAKVRMNCPECKISFKREMICRRAIFLSKKHYAAWIIIGENGPVADGDPHEIEVKGLESVKSSTPQIIRKYLKQFYKSILKVHDEIEVNKIVKKMYTDLTNMKPEEFAKISSANNIEKYTLPTGDSATGTPFHIKGCIGFNNLIRRSNMSDSIEKIFEGDKVKCVYIKGCTKFSDYPYQVVSFKDKLPSEFGFIVDYETNINKVFVEPIKQFYEVLKWNLPSFTTEDITEFFS
jgi:DNA polymerase elongation subunit (family B)